MSENVLPFVRAEGADHKILVENVRLRELLRQAGIPSDATEAPVDTGFMAGGGEMGALMRSMDWSQTSFGPVSGWSQALRSAVSICLTTRFPVVLYYGPERALIYNDAWRPVVGDKHPWSFGRAGTEVWAEIWDIIGPMFDTVFETGEATWSDDQLLPLNRFGYVEECYFYYSYSPIRGEMGRVEGIFTAVTETTLRVLADRRTRLLRDLAAQSIEAKSTAEAYAIAADVLAGDPHDVPFALLYTFDAGTDDLTLAGHVGLPEAREHLLRTGLAEEDLWSLRQVAATGVPILLEGLDRTMPGLPGGSWPESVTQARVLPVTAGAGGRTSGIAVIGISPRLRFDERYHAFCEQIASNLSAAVTNALAYQEERARAERLAELDRAKTAFFSNVSHEFRTPLTLMLSPLEEILAKPPGGVLPDNRALATVAHRNGLRLLRLVNGLLDFSRVEAGRTRAAFRPVDLPRFTAELAGNFRSLCEQAGLTLTVDCPALDALVPLDPEMWEKVVLNLLSNAFKFTLEGGITVRTQRDGDRAVLTVSDTGTGIPAEELPRLFDRFHRVEGAQGRTFEGSGIGLALVQDLVRLHQGTIGVASEPGRGSVFMISLPFVQADVGTSGAGFTPGLTAARVEAFVAEARRWIDGGAGADDLILDAEPAPDASRSTGRVLLADDNADMREHVARLLTAQGYEVQVTADGEAALAAARARRPDLLLTDVMMPRLDGFGLLAAVRADATMSDLPVIMLSARAGDEAKVEGLDAGADDYLTKPFSARELIARVGANLQLARVRREAADALRRVNEDLEREVAARTAERDRIWQVSHDMLGVADADGIWLAVNPAWTQILGWQAHDIVGRTSEWLEHPEDREKTRAEVRRLAGGATTLAFENRFLTRDDSYRTLSWTAVPADGRLYCVARDVTDKRAHAVSLAQAEEALRQSQKMEAVGQLTGGVAHDFNNLLTIIRSSVDFLRRPDLPEERRARYMDAVSDTVDRAAKLTGQLLAFARRQALKPETFDVGARLQAVAEMVDTVTGARIRVVADVPENPCFICADASQFETALVNMAINARDAMEGEGTLTLRLACDQAMPAIRGHGPSRNPFAAVSVADTGTGIEPETLARIFEPFFTTKEVGKGTGLGLSQVIGFAKQSGGDVDVASTVGQGTTFTLYLPQVSPVDEPAREDDGELAWGEGRRVLVVEDNVEVGRFATQILEDLGYETALAVNAEEALDRLGGDGAGFDAVFSDVVMPGMGGVALAEELRRRLPDLPVVLASGYSHVLAEEGAHGFELLHKPYSAEQISRVLNKVSRRKPRRSRPRP
ncbi:ATP-binding protein [Methylobacterium sp. SI9]|uniref:ATP-binding protein n=1 Tax=Methylobacterium guangdongense TaxID=3138811 RepID=UPI00313B7CBE